MNLPAGPAPATYRGAHGTFLRTRGWAVLLDVRPGHPLVDLGWDRLGAAADPDDVLEALVALGLQAVPACALVRETGVRRVVGRGALTLVLDGEDVLGDQQAGTWVDLPLADGTTVAAALTAGDLTGPALPLRDGAVAATGFHLVLDEPGTGRVVPTGPSRLTETARTAAAREASTVTVRVPADRATSSQDTLPTTFTSGLAPAEERRTEGREMFVTRRQLMRGDDGLEVPRVLAAVCPAGHLTPAYSGVCRVCRRVVAAQEAFETARPVLGRLVLPQGDSVLLDRGAVLGRAPYVPGEWAGAQPHLVALHDPEHDVSAQHVSVVLDLWNVLVCDLGSTNGSALLDSDGQVTRLRPHEPVPLRPGGSVVLADVITLRFEVQP